MDKLELLLTMGLTSQQTCSTSDLGTGNKVEQDEERDEKSAPPPSVIPSSLDQDPEKTESKPQETKIDAQVVNILTGLLNQTATETGALAKLNCSNTIDAKDLENAIKLTVPQLVSNIFSSIHSFSLTSQQSVLSLNHTIGKPEAGEPNMLVSIDGSKVNITNSLNATEMAAEGERLFTKWLDHYLDDLKLTAAMANHIRKSALNLFSRILRQYIQGVERMGGNIQENLRRGIQMALSNTQSLTSFLLRNYINFSAGLMQLIGDQVSRVGKRIDTTGDAISHINMNPFDIVSNVLDSLPNPADLSRYFKSIGKYLAGESITDQPAAESSSVQKTISNIGKTLTSWMG